MMNLNERIDSRDLFMSNHSIRSGGQGAVASAKRRAKPPKWARTDKGIQKIIRLAFPHFETNERQRKFAARWARVIYLYFRVGYTYSQIAEEMKLYSKIPNRPYNTVEMTIKHIQRAAEGKTSGYGGHPPVLYGSRHKGRPKKFAT
jgi:hypothetical protein